MKPEEDQPLRGMRIAVTRAKEQAAAFASRIEALGGMAVLCPVIRTVPCSDASLQEAFLRAGTYDWLLFTSVNGVKCFIDALERFGISLEQFAGARIGAVGPKTAAALESRGLKAEFIPNVYTGDEMAYGLLEYLKRGDRVLLPRARVARSVLPETLRRHGAHVDDVPIYETVLSEEGIQEAVGFLRRGELDAVTFTSSSTVSNFLEVLRRCGVERPEEALSPLPMFSIGPLTSETLRRSGLRRVHEAEEATVDSLIQALIKYRNEIGGEHP